jgi:cellulose synthase/poly-beta-1,6-N-acetylglucosamine synthase-like glycosyltransferase
MYSPDSIKKLVRNFADKAVGGVSGDVRLIVSGGGSSFDISENLYYKYERYLQLKESQIWSLICADGAMYAIRRELYKTPKLNAVSCDDVIPMGIVKAGYRVVYEPEAIGVEDSAPDWKEEFRRRVRMAGFGINNFLWARYFPNIQQMWLLIEYISHRLLRWIAPFFLITCFVTNIFLLEKGNFYIGMFIFQVIFYISGLVGMALGKDKYIFGIIFYFCLGNVGNIVGVIKSIMRKQHEIWKPTERRT